jgi:hypothetical protein
MDAEDSNALKKAIKNVKTVLEQTKIPAKDLEKILKKMG